MRIKIHVELVTDWEETITVEASEFDPYAQPYIVEALEGNGDVEEVGPPEATAATAQYLNNRKLSIYGGSNEIQRNIISKMILGL